MRREPGSGRPRGRLLRVAFGTALGLAVVGAAALFVLGAALRREELPPGPARARPGASEWLDIPAPRTRFATLDGDSASLADYRGRTVILNFWGSWCAPCLTEIPHLVEVQRELTSVGGTIIGPAVGSGSPEEIRRFMEEHGMTWPVWIADSGRAVEQFGVVGYPFTLLIDGDGVIRRTYLGAQTQETLLRDVRALREGKTLRTERRGEGQPTSASGSRS